MMVGDVGWDRVIVGMMMGVEGHRMRLDHCMETSGETGLLEAS